MKHPSGLPGRLHVTVEFTDATPPALTIAWAPADATAARSRFEYARLFMITPHAADRRYLDIVDGKPTTTLHLPHPLTPGDYAIEVDAYGSASWGDGRLEARGRSTPFHLGTAEPAR
ncbi:hypothetical protein AB0H76_04195 [Nocardia sp. NPDC050712]|uniref:hypothetical protein n=1 Tax=Nocardia sp. NPDC050712 TaxID=3155518 RepID=UPI0033ED3E75